MKRVYYSFAGLYTALNIGALFVVNALGKTPFALADEGYGYATLLVKRPSTAALLKKLAEQ